MLLTALALSALIQPDRWVHVGGSPDAYEEYLDKERRAQRRQSDLMDPAGPRAGPGHRLERNRVRLFEEDGNHPRLGPR
jgi:hypothetical protein